MNTLHMCISMWYKYICTYCVYNFIFCSFWPSKIVLMKVLQKLSVIANFYYVIFKFFKCILKSMNNVFDMNFDVPCWLFCRGRFVEELSQVSGNLYGFMYYFLHVPCLGKVILGRFSGDEVFISFTQQYEVEDAMS